MAGLFDFLQGVMGRPDPQQQLAASLGQAPGQPGSPQGPQPLAGQNAPPGGPAGPGGSPDPSGGPPQQQQQQQGPQVYQSPPDLAQMYLALQQRDQARQQFNSGLGLLAASMYPGRHPEMIMKAMSGGGEDSGSLFSNFVQLQQYQQQAQALQAYRQGVPAMVKAAGLPDSFVPLAMADPTLLSKIVETQAGVGGSQTDKEYKQAVKVYQTAHPNEPLPPDLQTEAGFAAGQVGNVAHAKEMQDFKDSGVEDLSSVEPRFDKGEKTVDTLLGNMDATMTALQAPGFLTRGPVPGYLGGGPYGKEVKDAAAAMATLKATLAGEGLKNTKNVRNVREFNTLAESMTAALDPSNSPAQVEQALRDIKSGIARAHAQALAVAGKQVPYAYKGLADPRYFIRGGPYDTGATQEEAPADSSGGGGGPQQSGGSSGGDAPPVPGAKKASDGNWYVPDPARPGKYMRVE